MKDIDKNSIDDLLIRYLTGFANNDEKVKVGNWLNSDQENQSYFKKFKKVWELSSNLKQYQKIDTESSLKNVKSRIGLSQDEKSKVKPLWMAVRIAAAIVIFIGFYFIFRNKDDVSETLKMVKIESSSEIKIVTLPDNSTVTLNVASILEFPENFEGKERRIKFEGEAFFEVASDKSKPFIIETAKSETRVVGTAFNLKAKTNEDTESIVVTEGVVEFSEKTKKTKEVVRLVKGERAVLNSDLKKEENTDPNFMAWKTGVLTFENHALPEALMLLSEQYKVQFKIGDSTLGAYTIDGVYEKDKLNVQEVVEILEMTLGLKVEKEKDNIFRLKRR